MNVVLELWKCGWREPSIVHYGERGEPDRVEQWLTCDRAVYRQVGDPAPHCAKSHGPMTSEGLYEFETDEVNA